MRGLIAKGLHRVAAALAPGTSGWVSLDDAQALLNAGGYTSAAGKTVTEARALCVSAVWACTKRTAEMIASLPGQLFDRQSDGQKVPIDDALVEILRVKPNTNQTAVEFWEGQVARMVLNGNAYAERLEFRGRLVGLQPLHRVTPKWDRDQRRFRYEVNDRGRREVLPADKVFHMRGFGVGDGLGLSAIQYGAQTIGSALAADEAAGQIFKNGLIGSSAIETDQTLDTAQRSQLQTLLDAFIGSDNAGKILPLEAGFKIKGLNMNPEDAELLATRHFNVEDVCRWFGVPPVVIGHASQGQTMWGSGVEAIMLAWRTSALNPLLRRLEARILCDLVPAERRARWSWKWNREAILEMDSTSKGEFLSKMRTAGIMSADEARAKLDLPLRGGAADDLVVQRALAPIDVIREEGNA